MICELLSVGTELLMGQIVNTDAQFLAQQMAQMGFTVYHQSVVGDNMIRLVEEIERAAERSDILILSGGLGPTEDDMTKWAVAEYLGVNMMEYESEREILEGFFKGVNKTITPNNYRQIQFPKGSEILPNSCGTAPGCICCSGDTHIIILPGPPHELTAMFEKSVRPYLEKLADKKFYTKMLRIEGIGESSVEHAIKHLIHEQSNPTIAPYALLGEVKLRITAACADEKEGEALVSPVLDEILRLFGDHVYSCDDESMEQVISKLLKEKGKTLAIAESLTGGAISASLVNYEGMSKHLLEGIIVYTNEAKVRLGVNPKTIEEHSAVSYEVAYELSEKIRERSGADYGLSVTGVAGPGADERGNPQGLYFVGIADNNGVHVKQFNGGASNRMRARMLAQLSALNELRLLMKK